eukprot:scaffold287493_cov18-Tisochrysis_lutea.AAC.3
MAVLLVWNCSQVGYIEKVRCQRSAKDRANTCCPRQPSPAPMGHASPAPTIPLHPRPDQRIPSWPLL